MTAYPSTARRSTDIAGVTHPVRVTCSCETCFTNAKDLGKAFPLVGYITESAAKIMNITKFNADKTRKTHALVELANHPVLGPSQRGVLAG